MLRTAGAGALPRRAGFGRVARMSALHRLSRRGLLALAPLLAARCAATADRPCDFAAPNAVPVAVTGALPFVAMTVNGWPATALLDTGAERTLVAETLLAGIGLPVDPRRRAFQTGVTGNTEARPVAYLPRVRLGALELTSLGVGVVAPPGMRAPDGNPPQLVLGGDVLAQHDLDLDLPARRLTLYQARPCQLAAAPFPGPTYELPMRVARNHIIAAVEANGRPAEAIIDTGANLVHLSRSRALSLGVTEAELAAAPKHSVRGINNTQVEQAAIRLATLRIGPEMHRNVPALVGQDGLAEFVIGTPWLLNRRLFVSYVNRRLLVRVPAGMPSA